MSVRLPQSGLALLLLLLIISELGVLLAGLSVNNEALQDLFAAAARASFVGLCVVTLFKCSVREWAMSAMALALCGFAALRANWPELIGNALDLGVFLGVFIALLTFMKEAAVRSEAITKVGVYLTQQPPGKRYLSVSIGSHIMGVLLNFGAVSLLVPLVQKGARASLDEDVKVLEQRQISALVRGFSWFLMWAPTSLAQAILLRLFAEVDYSKLLMLGAASTCLMIALGRMLDRYNWKVSSVPNARNAIPAPTKSIGEIVLVSAALVAGTVIGYFGADFSVAESLMFVAPAMTLVWLKLQAQQRARMPQASAAAQNSATSIPQIFNASALALARSAIALGLSGFIGHLCGNIVPSADIAQWISDLNMSPWLFLCILPIIITLGGQIALSPMVFVVFLGQILASIPVLPAEPTQIVFALSVGWALSMTASPNATATLLIAAAGNIAPTTLTWKWNGRYAILCYLVFTVIFYLITL